jgi:hypothetical protein
LDEDQNIPPAGPGLGQPCPEQSIGDLGARSRRAPLDDFVENVKKKRLLLDHILLSPGLLGGSGLRAVPGSGRVHHAEWEANVSSGGMRRDRRPTDHRPVSVELQY